MSLLEYLEQIPMKSSLLQFSPLEQSLKKKDLGLAKKE